MDRFHYREGEVARRALEMEHAHAEALDKIAALERELWAARKRLRRRVLVGALPPGGIGALLGTFLGAAAWGLLDTPAFMLAGAMLGGLFGVIVHGLSSEADHDGFPAAPPERLR